MWMPKNLMSSTHSTTSPSMRSAFCPPGSPVVHGDPRFLLVFRTRLLAEHHRVEYRISSLEWVSSLSDMRPTVVVSSNGCCGSDPKGKEFIHRRSICLSDLHALSVPPSCTQFALDGTKVTLQLFRSEKWFLCLVFMCVTSNPPPPPLHYYCIIHKMTEPTKSVNTLVTCDNEKMEKMQQLCGMAHWLHMLWMVQQHRSKLCSNRGVVCWNTS